MPASIDRRSWPSALTLLLVALAAVVGYLQLSPGQPRRLGGEALVVAMNALAAIAIAVRARAEAPWRSARHLATIALLLAIAAGALLALDLRGRTLEPSLLDLSLLILLVPLLANVREEYRCHLPAEDRREIAIDAVLITASLAAIAYVIVRPVDSAATVSLSAATFAILAAVLFAPFAVLALWAPSPSHLLRWVVFSAFAAAAVALGWEWTRGAIDRVYPAIDIVFVAGAPLLATGVLWFPRRDVRQPEEQPHALARPILTSVAVISAFAALATVASLDGARGISATESTATIGLLGLGVAIRVIVNQVRSTQAHTQAKLALREKERALSEADMALDRVSETNETLRQSEEHLRLVFEAAVDGIVELDHEDVILRANDAFCGMVRVDRYSIEGLRWSALAASVSGADDEFASLPITGRGTIQRPEGQPLYLESRISDVPMTPPRRLLLVRDVTAGRVADQTIRSLFKFLQDRDEDRTRLLRRTNTAIEAERNRIARDLHDGPVQGVSAASLSLEAALLMIKAGEIDRGIEVLSKIRKELASEADGLRALMSGLRPPLLEERGLIPAIRETLTRFGAEQGVQTELSGTVGSEIDDDLETLAYRVVQEALSNAARHANADRVSVAVESDPTQLRVEVADDGVGFESNRAREFLRMGRVGLASMRERVELASGTLVVRSMPGRGTTIVATLPVDNGSAGGDLPASRRR